VRARAAIDGLAGAAEMVTAQMSLAKGLEFRAVVVMACDEGVLPLDERVADAADEAELDDIYETERRLLYVACTRAREPILARRSLRDRIERHWKHPAAGRFSKGAYGGAGASLTGFRRSVGRIPPRSARDDRSPRPSRHL
jgi:UvrD-like helicase C-terminal domain